MTQRRLIEETFPLKKVSEDSKHEKNVRHGHISTLHIWPARRPLAACRAAIIAALLPDPGDEPGRHELNQKIESITRWGSENGPALDFFRREIRQAFGGRAPRVLDMFAGGGAIPLEAMRLGCEVTAIDYNPVAWFILKCTLEFPQRLAGKTWPLPTAKDELGGMKDEQVVQLSLHPSSFSPQPSPLADHVRWWGEWVLDKARAELSPYYPTINNQPTVAYLWARTVPCPDPACGAEVPLLKTLWLCQTDKKRRALRLVPDMAQCRVNFEIWTPGPKDEVPEGTMSGAKCQCSVCGVNLTPSYIKECGHADKMSARMTAVVIDTGKGKEYRPPTPEEETAARQVMEVLPQAAAQIPYGLPTEPLPGPDILGFRMPLYGFKTWASLFTPRQLLALVTFVKWTRAAREEMRRVGYPEEWVEATIGELICVLDKTIDYNSSVCTWYVGNEQIRATSARYALPIVWDFAEAGILEKTSGGFPALLDYTLRVIKNLFSDVFRNLCQPNVFRQSATDSLPGQFDAIITDPPYYDAIPYADLSDFFYVWLHRTVGDQYPDIFALPLTTKTDELVQQAEDSASGRKGKADYETGMAAAFRRAWEVLTPDGRMVIVFAHKNPEAWETLVVAMIQAGLTVTASWPIDTEMSNRTRAMGGSAALASSIWMVCRKRPENAGVGRYVAVKRAMQERVTERLRYFWDIGLSGPDFVWAAVGPALEAYSAYQEVRRMDGTPFTVGEFLREVRRMVADFALGQILHGRSTEGVDEWTRYYLMHRAYFSLEAAPVGECLMLSQGYGLDFNEIRGPRGFISKGGSNDVRLTKWDERTRDDLGEPHPGGGLPQIDMLHRLLRLWAAGKLDAVNEYATARGLGQNELFWAIAQAVLEMSEAKSRERTLLEAIVAWGRGKTTETQRPEQLGFSLVNDNS